MTWLFGTFTKEQFSSDSPQNESHLANSQGGIFLSVGELALIELCVEALLLEQLLVLALFHNVAILHD